MSKAIVVRAQALDGTWETIGSDRRYGIVPESVSLEADVWGPSRASFDVRRDPRVTYPDLSAFTPVEVEEGGRLIWSGRVSETPAPGGKIMNVQCEGWQYHLDDDIYSKVYVKNNMAEWKDQRSWPTTSLSAFTAGAQVVSSEGAIEIAWPIGTIVVSTALAGVFLDLGPNDTASRISIDWESSNNHGGMYLYARGTPGNDATGAGGLSDAIVLLNTAGPSGTTTGAFAAGTWRYVSLFIYYPGGTGAASADIYFRLKGIRVFTSAAYESAGQSVLGASTVVTDALTRATSLLNPDRSLLQATNFSIPTVDLGPQTPRQAWTAVDAYHNWMKKIDVYARPVYAPMPSRPSLDFGSWSGGDVTDASMNSGQEIYNRTILSGPRTDGNNTDLLRAQGQSSSDRFWADASGIGGPGGSFAFLFNTAVRFRKGVTYAVRIDVISASAFVGAGSLTGINVGNGTGGPPWTGGDIVSYPTSIAITSAGLYGPFPFVLWTPAADTTQFGMSASWTGNYHVDIHMEVMWGNTLPERRGFSRTMQLPIDSTMPWNDDTALGAIGDIWLQAHKTTPFKGSVPVVGDGAIRDSMNGQNVPAGVLLSRTNEIVRLLDRVDPDTGGLGRDARIVNVSYTPANATATVSFDNTRDLLAPLLARMAVVTANTH
jgi:hypothetical protein